MRSSYLAYGLLGLLFLNVTAVACGSDAGKKTARAEDGGAAGAAGAKASNGVGGAASLPNGGTPAETPVGGVGGVPSEPGAGGVPVEVTGGSGGAGGEPSSLPPLPVVNCDTINFKDTQLDNLVRFLVGKATGDLVPADVATLTVLDASDNGIADLTGIECLTSLESASFDGGEVPNQITNVDPLRYLSKLTSLDLSNNPVADFAPLVYLQNLTDLSINDYSSLPDVTPLGDLPKLQHLYMNGCTLGKPESLSALTNIDTLVAVQTIDDAALINGLTQLRHLELGFMALNNADKLGDLQNLTFLDVLDMGMNSAAPLATLTELIHLDLQEDPIVDLGPLQNLTGLKELGLFAISATTIKPLVDNQGLSNGDTLNLSNVPLNCANEKANTDALIARGVAITGNPCP